MISDGKGLWHRLISTGTRTTSHSCHGGPPLQDQSVTEIDERMQLGTPYGLGCISPQGLAWLVDLHHQGLISSVAGARFTVRSQCHFYRSAATHSDSAGCERNLVCAFQVISHSLGSHSPSLVLTTIPAFAYYRVRMGSVSTHPPRLSCS